MTATPIPRTLALSLYGDLDISILDEMPPGRPRIITRLVDPTNRNKAYDFIRGQVKMGRQVFVICPLIETKELKDKETKKQNKLFELERKSVVEEYKKLSENIFPDLKIAMLHGKMKSREKARIMQEFATCQFNILVSTSVVEVGIDISNATVMMIEDADRFGLAQLHQFRGRVGRGKYTSYCLLFTSNLSEEAKRRLKALEESSDGFHLAERDLSSRGPGDFVGARQHGVPDLKMATLTDIMLIKRSRVEAEKIVNFGLNKYPLLVNKLKDFAKEYHLE